MKTKGRNSQGQRRIPLARFEVTGKTNYDKRASKPLRRDAEVTEEESRAIWDASPTSASLPDTTWD